jgi:hypothetical protein
MTCGITLSTSERIVAEYWIVIPLEATTNPTMASTDPRVQQHPFGTRDSGMLVRCAATPDRKGGGISRHGTTKVTLLFLFLFLFLPGNARRDKTKSVRHGRVYYYVIHYHNIADRQT